jgi:hypothetical protein
MDDEMFELITKMYNEVTTLRKEVDVIGKSQLKFDNDLKPKVEAALEGYAQVYEKQLEHDKRFDAHDRRFNEHDRRFDILEAKLQKHNVEIKVIKGGLSS